MVFHEEYIAVIAIASIFVVLPWIIFHYITKWKATATLTTEDENLLDELHDLARRLDDRMRTIERIIQADNPNWRQLGADPVETALEDRSERLYEAAGRAPRTPRRNG
jgi:phage shock protein B